VTPTQVLVKADQADVEGACRVARDTFGARR
jgi:hypothetical protein